MSDQKYVYGSHKHTVITDFLQAVIDSDGNNLSLKIKAAEAWDAMEAQKSYDPAVELLKAKFSHTFKTDE